jgi:Ser/Thr protein kinase RdoA (MazF antagonist)
MAASPAPTFDSVLARMYQREGIDGLPAHIEQTYGVTISKVSKLDVGVLRIDRNDKEPTLVARLFSSARTYGAAEADLAVLRYLAEVGFPAERAFGDEPLSEYVGQALLLTEFIKEAPKAKRPPHEIVRLGARIGRLHQLPVPAGADRPSGALHHFAEGTMADELRAVEGWLASIEPRVPSENKDALAALRATVAEADGGDGLPEGLVHPDPVPKNAIFTAEGPVLVDWTSAGRGPRLPSMTLILRSGWAAVPFMKGYARVASLTGEERARLAAVLFSRQLIDHVFRVCREPETIATSGKRVAAIRRDTEAKAQAILDS